MLAPTPITITGRYARLEPLTLHHADGLFSIGQESSIWRWMIRGPFVDLADCREWIAAALQAQQASGQIPFAIIANASNRVAGSTRYFNISVPDRGLEIGHTWLGVDYQRTAVNTECKWLLLRHAFEALGCARVQLKTDALNERSRAAIERIGAKFEGVLRKLQLTQKGRIRDTAMYSITDEEWPEVRARLEARLA